MSMFVCNNECMCIVRLINIILVPRVHNVRESIQRPYGGCYITVYCLHPYTSLVYGSVLFTVLSHLKSLKVNNS